MSFDRSEYEELLSNSFGRRRARSQNEAFRERHLTAEMLQRASVNAEYLTGDPLWDEYLTFISALIDREKINRGYWMDEMLNPVNCANDKLVECKLNILIIDSRIAAWETAMEIPGHIRNDGEQAKKWLADHGLDLESSSG